uniref:Uncharacterized protein n=1 Tax=Rhizophagus irregularis (strain DAOM 181602 / DAOM 197198 / MUCL 43194) TaxID=747089 RepID=U9SH68_RHIID
MNNLQKIRKEIEEQEKELLKLENLRTQATKELTRVQLSIENCENWINNKYKELLNEENKEYGEVSSMSYQYEGEHETVRRRDRKKLIQNEIEKLKIKRTRRYEFLKVLRPLLSGFTPLEQKIYSEIENLTQEIEGHFERIARLKSDFDRLQIQPTWQNMILGNLQKLNLRKTKTTWKRPKIEGIWNQPKVMGDEGIDIFGINKEGSVVVIECKGYVLNKSLLEARNVYKVKEAALRLKAIPIIIITDIIKHVPSGIIDLCKQENVYLFDLNNIHEIRDIKMKKQKIKLTTEIIIKGIHFNNKKLILKIKI